MTHRVDLTQSAYYPYHLTWDELNNPGIVLQQFLDKWDLLHCRLLLRKWQNLVLDGKYSKNDPSHKEITSFIEDFEKLIEAIYIIKLQGATEAEQ